VSCSTSLTRLRAAAGHGIDPGRVASSQLDVVPSSSLVSSAPRQYTSRQTDTSTLRLKNVYRPTTDDNFFSQQCCPIPVIFGTRIAE